ncbi:hypothetical protein OG304_02075 [Streptomyces sp. NBC_00160]|uniref:Uncharacterized protein n=1 Tax=Streptomyces spororaveus TaxID=284039 RepID=A0ABQ3T849_9ACTN|nr:MULTISPECIES: hypothetical protein [Streptomyces]MCM9082985.1 hypothetical protein [Streptomyces spororaveus]MCX5302241.1 hypothetical protein [Streptomyces sp. NBC_00160]GHI76581.1 hypothetical protein Sspor_21420 [Streptomyces spororaveus]
MTTITRLPEAAAGPAAVAAARRAGNRACTGARPACAAAAPARTHPAATARPGRPGTRATAASGRASLPTESGRAGRAAAHGTASPAPDRAAGPEGHRTTGEGA